MSEPPYPLHPYIAGRIDVEYAAFYNQHLTDKQQVHLQPLAASRASGVLHLRRRPPLPPRRVARPGPRRPLLHPGRAPAPGRLARAALLPRRRLGPRQHRDGECRGHQPLCSRARCVVSVDYRLAPENLFPAAAVMCQRAVSRGSPAFRLQLLSVPVADNTADPSSNPSWADN